MILTSDAPRRNSGIKTEVIPEDVDALLAQELNQMSFEERELVYEEIHGVETLIEETPDFVYAKLDALELEIQRINEKPAYELAEQMSREYVTDSKFRLMFLRAERFDERLAAMRLVKFMDGKLEFFGSETLTRPVYMSDLSKEELAIVKSGRLQVLPARDRSGRCVTADIKMDQMPHYSSLDNLVCTFWRERTEKIRMNSIYSFTDFLRFAAAEGFSIPDARYGRG
jgi:hypothetical protein